MKTKKFFCLGIILISNIAVAKIRTALDVQREYLECIKSKECQERHKVKIVTTWDILQDYTKITEKNLQKIKLERKRKEEEKKRKKLEEEKKRKEFDERLKREEEKRRREHKEFINGLKRWFGRMKF